MQGLSQDRLELSSYDTQGLEKMCVCLELRIQVVQQFTGQHTLSFPKCQAHLIRRL